MAMDDADFASLREMQAPCTQLESDARTLRAFGDALSGIRDRYQSRATATNPSGSGSSKTMP